MRADLVLLTAAVLLSTPLAGRAQTGEAPRGRTRVSIDGGSQTTQTSFEGSRSFEEFVEPGSLTLHRVIPSRSFFDVGASVRIWNALHVGVTVSYFADNGKGTVTAQIPHPFHFSQPRSITGEAAGIKRKELAGHIQLGWVIPARAVELTLSGGPSIFRTEQAVVERIEYAQAYPYDTAEFRSAAIERLQGSVLGYNAGLDVTWRFSARVGVGALVRFARGKKDLQPSSGEAIPIESGGLHAGGGLRLAF